MKAFKYELRLSEAQRNQCNQIAGICRYVWNRALAMKKESWEKEKKKISEFDLNNLLVQWKRELAWMSLAPSQSLQQVNKDLSIAFKSFFNGSGYPKFKKRGVRDSFRLPQGVSLLRQLSNKVGVVQFPKLKKVRFVKSREVEGKIKYATVSRKCDKWFVSFTCEVEMDVEQRDSGPIVGIDRGVTILAQCSDGKSFPGLAPMKNELNKLRKLSKNLSRKEKRSSNWKKAKLRIQKLYRHMADKRKDDIHKITTQLAKNHGIVVMEDLKTKNMTKSAKGTVENPGSNVRAKSGLNRSILDSAWNMFQRFLEYKMAWSGGRVVYVSPSYTSQRCSECGYTSKENRKTQSGFFCLSCNHESNADLNASKNILKNYLKAAGHAVLACGEGTVVLSVKQELERRKSHAI